MSNASHLAWAVDLATRIALGYATDEDAIAQACAKLPVEVITLWYCGADEAFNEVLARPGPTAGVLWDVIESAADLLQL